MMKVLLLLWIYFSAAMAKVEHWVNFGGRSYAVYNIKLDFVSSSERCSDKNAALANFLPSYNFTKFVNRMRLEKDTKYWISVGKSDYLSTSCVALSVLRQRRKWLLLSSNCSASNQYICEREPSHNVPKPLTDVPTTSATTGNLVAPTCTGPVSVDPTPAGMNEKCRTKPIDKVPPIYSTPHQLEPSFKSEVVSPTIFDPFQTLAISRLENRRKTSNAFETHSMFFSHNSIWKPMPSTSSDLPETILQLATEIPEPILTSNQLPPISSQGYNDTENLSELHQLCRAYLKQEILTKNFTKFINLTAQNGVNDSLVINVKETNKYRRRLTSADDQRTSSKAMGVAAVIVIATVLLCIMAMDVPLVLHDINVLTGDLYSRLKY